MAYRTIKKTALEAAQGERTYMAVDMETQKLRFGYNIASDIRDKKIRGLRTFTLNASVKFYQKWTPTLGEFYIFSDFTDIECERLPDMGKAVAFMARDVDNGTVSRTMNVDGEDVSYEVGIKKCGGNAVIYMALPEGIARQDSNADGIVYRKLPEKKRRQLFRNHLEPVMDDCIGNGGGFFKRVKRFEGKCVTVFCPEPRLVTNEELAKLFERYLERDGETTITKGRKNSLTSVSNVSPRFRVHYRNFIIPYVNLCFSDLGLEIPEHAVVEYEEYYKTAFGEGIRKAAAKVGGSALAIATAVVDAVGGGLAEYEKRRYERMKEEKSRVAEWLAGLGARNATATSIDGIELSPEERSQGCLIFVDPACELRVRKGEIPEELKKEEATE